ncbi:MAG: response regulator [Planctomycetota bacterium]
MARKILIVDDQPLNVAVLEELLEDDYTLETANSGQEALSKIASFAPDLILLDVMMPGMSGLEVCRAIRSDARFAGAVVVLLSAKAMKEDIETGLAAGANDYVTKPFGHAEILAKVEECIESLA